MSQQHKIGWLNLPGYKGETWNPIIGYSKVSDGCKNCYAENMAYRIANIELSKYGAYSDRREYKNVVQGVFSGAGWNGKTHFVQSAIDKPMRWKKPRVIFVCSMGDLFHEDTSFEEINAVFSVMSDNDQHVYIVLTKRPQRIIDFYNWKSSFGVPWVPKNNVWMGVTAENQQTANERIPKLLKIPAAVRFVSVEPMLGPVDLEIISAKYWGNEYKKGFEGINLGVLQGGKNTKTPWHINWVICGGESGPGARPMHPDWARSLRDQCQAAGVPFFFKQWGEWLPWELDAQPPFIKSQNGQTIDSNGINIYNTETGKTNPKWDDGLWTVPENLSPCCFEKVGRKAAGNLLDGVKHEEYPQTKINL